MKVLIVIAAAMMADAAQAQGPAIASPAAQTPPGYNEDLAARCHSWASVMHQQALSSAEAATAAGKAEEAKIWTRRAENFGRTYATSRSWLAGYASARGVDPATLIGPAERTGLSLFLGLLSESQADLKMVQALGKQCGPLLRPRTATPSP